MTAMQRRTCRTCLGRTHFYPERKCDQQPGATSTGKSEFAETATPLVGAFKFEARRSHREFRAKEEMEALCASAGLRHQPEIRAKSGRRPESWAPAFRAYPDTRTLSDAAMQSNHFNGGKDSPLLAGSQFDRRTLVWPNRPKE